MLTQRGARWHVFSTTVASVFLAAMLAGAIYSAIHTLWIPFGLFAVTSIFQASLIVFVIRGRRRQPPD
jgi:hypothetical protein